MQEDFTKSILNECREMMTDQVCLSMSSMMDEAELQLNELASREKSLGKAMQYYDAIRLLRIKQHEMQIRFEKRFDSIFKYRAEHYLNVNPNTNITLSKVGHTSFIKESEDLNEKQKIESSVYNIKSDCQTVLLNIDKKMSALMQNIEINPFDNPMLPETIFEAFWESCRDIKLKKEIRLLLINLFEKYLSSDLKFLYENINKNLARHYISKNTGN